MQRRNLTFKKNIYYYFIIETSIAHNKHSKMKIETIVKMHFSS